MTKVLYHKEKRPFKCMTSLSVTAYCLHPSSIENVCKTMQPASVEQSFIKDRNGFFSNLAS